MHPSKYFSLGIAASLISGTVFSDELNQISSSGRFALGGYGDVKYESSDLQDTSAFSARFVPIFLFSLGEKMHVEAETEIALNSEGETEIELEYADIHYFLTDSTTITAGKFLLPFGQFGANWHPSWINRSPWTPGIYGSHGSQQAMTPLLPVLSDVGIALQKTWAFASNHRVFLDVYLTNGARSEVSAHADEDEEGGEEELQEEDHTEALPEVEFEATSADNNKDKAIGGRLAYAFLPGIEIGGSYYRASYDEDERLDVVARGVDLNLIGSHYIIRGEYVQTDTDGIDESEENVSTSFKRNGWFIQGVLQIGQIYSSLGGTELVLERAEAKKLEEATRWVLGVNYWLDARSVIKLAYEDTEVEESDDDKRLALQFSYGF